MCKSVSRMSLLTQSVCCVQIRDLEALKLPGIRCWKRFCLKRLQVLQALHYVTYQPWLASRVIHSVPLLKTT